MSRFLPMGIGCLRWIAAIARTGIIGASSSFMVAGERLLSAGMRRFMGALSTSPPLCELDVVQAFPLAERKPKLRLRLPVSWEAPS
jgi:hypothetical protein